VKRDDKTSMALGQTLLPEQITQKKQNAHDLEGTSLKSKGPVVTQAASLRHLEGVRKGSDEKKFRKPALIWRIGQ